MKINYIIVMLFSVVILLITLRGCSHSTSECVVTQLTIPVNQLEVDKVNMKAFIEASKWVGG